MAERPAAGEAAREAAAEQVERLAAGLAFIVATGMSELVQVGQYRQPAHQRDGVAAMMVAAGAAEHAGLDALEG
jgi:hypothetical protein